LWGIDQYLREHANFDSSQLLYLTVEKTN